MMNRRICLSVLALTVATSLTAQTTKESAPAVATQDDPAYIDDEKLFDDFMDKLTTLAKDGKCLAYKKLRAKMKSGTRVKLSPAKPGDKPLSPEEVYRRAVPSVFVVGSVYKDEQGEWQDGLYATAWVVASDGVLVTSWHVFEDLEPGEVFGALDYKGNVYPMIDFLGGDKIADVAVFRIDAKNLTPLPVATTHAEVGSWVGVLSHPGDNFFVFTTGTVTRYSTNTNDDGQRERWMGVTAEYGGGSSGAPILNKYGAVTGIAALTLTIDDGAGVVNPPARKRLLVGRPPRSRIAKRQPPVAPPPRERGKPAEVPPPAVQMILKMGVPGPAILRCFEE